MIEAIVVFWLMIDQGGSRDSPVFVPEPFVSIEDCQKAGDVFKGSELDVLEDGKYVCLPQTKETEP